MTVDFTTDINTTEQENSDKYLYTLYQDFWAFTFYTHFMSI